MPRPKQSKKTDYKKLVAKAQRKQAAKKAVKKNTAPKKVPRQPLPPVAVDADRPDNANLPVASHNLNPPETGSPQAPNSIRCKFSLDEVRDVHGHSVLYFTARYDPNIEEDRRFSKSTPTGHVEIRIDNPSALSFFKVGSYYYFDATLAT